MPLLRKSRLERRSSPALYILLSFFLPCAIMIIALIGLEVSPFGDHSLIISDAHGYYINTLSYAGRMLRGLEGITYSFEKGLGGNMTGHLNGILLTPFAFLLGLADISRYPAVYSLISVLNLSLAGLTMYLFLADRYGHGRIGLIFSVSYAMMGFQTANVFQAVFFCAAPILPVMALGLTRLMKGRSPVIYIFSIAWGMASNAYFGFVLAVASVLFFFTELAFGGEAYEGRRFRLFVRYALSSLCGGLIAAVLWVPGFLSLRGGRLDQTSLGDFSFAERQPLLEIGAKLFTGANNTGELVSGHPNIFVGLLPVALAILFFLDRNTPRRHKYKAALLLSVYLLAFYITAFDMLMHGGTSPNWFNFRYSYVFSFLILTLAASLWQRLEDVPYGEMKRCLVIMIIAAVLIFSRSYSFVMGGEVVLDFALLMAVFLAFWMHRRRPEVNPRRLFDLITLLLVCISMFLNYRISIKNIRVWEVKTSDFENTVMNVDPLVQGVKAADRGFYRMEVNKQFSGTCGNDPMLYGYNGVGHGGSNERNFVRSGLNKLGIPWFDMRNYYADGIPAATDSLLGVKYVVAEEDLTEEKGYERRISLGTEGLYENHDVLPVVILSGAGVDEVETDFTSVFHNLNRAWAALADREEAVFTEEEDIRFRYCDRSEDLALTAGEAREAVEKADREAEAASSESQSKDSESRVLKSEKPDSTSCIEYTWVARQDGPVYIYQRNALTDLGRITEPTLTWLGNYRRGDTVTGYMAVDGSQMNEAAMEELCGRFRAAYADPQALSRLSETVRARSVTVEKERETRLTGSFTAEEGQVLLFTIPWDQGWSLYIDGEPAELRMTLDVLMSADAPVGAHTYTLRYMPAGLRLGAVVSAAALVFTILYLALGRSVGDRLWALAAKRRAAAQEEPEASEASDAPEEPDTSEKTDAPEEPDTSEKADTPEEPVETEVSHDPI